MRGDVLCYTSEPLAEDLEVTGPIRVVLFAATDGRDTDWTAKLVDVSPTGYARNLCDGIIRARYREGMTATTLLEPGTICRYLIEVGVTGNVFRAGHRIRVDVSSSNFPRFDRNPNTGNPLGLDDELRTAHQTVYHSRRYPSHVVLPVIPRRP
jgi:putative CocE/NonD family hydrolase